MKIPSAFDSSAGVAIVVSGFLIACAGFIWGGTFEANGHRIGTLFDDALISMRYASNLVSGHGLVWTPGESPRVEGYTNLGWTLVMSMVLAMFSIWQAPIVVSLIGVLIVLYSGFIGRSIILSVGVNPKFAHLGLIAVLSYFPFMFWTLRGMEVGLIGLLLLQCILITLNLSQINSRDDKKNVATISLLAAIAFLVRNDSALLFLILIGFCLRETDWKRNFAIAVFPFAVGVILQIGFRYATYGEFLPNTYFLKMTGVPLSGRLTKGAGDLLLCLPPMAFAILMSAVSAWVTQSRKLRMFQLMTLSVVMIELLYVVRIGGDAWVIDSSNRFIATVVPLLLLSAIAGASDYCTLVCGNSKAAVSLSLLSAAMFVLFVVLGALDRVPGSSWVWAFGWLLTLCAPLLFIRILRVNSHSDVGACSILLIFGLMLMASVPAWSRYFHQGAHGVNHDIAFAKQGLFLKDRLPPGSVVAAAWLGAPSYFAGFKTIDLLGKVDKYIARLPGSLPYVAGHNKVDLEYSVNHLRPDIVLGDSATFEKFGYIRLNNGLWIRSDNALLTSMQASLGMSWCGNATDSTFCPK